MSRLRIAAAIMSAPWFLGVLTTPLLGQIPVSEIELRTVPEATSLRPLEDLVIQVLIYGEVKDSEGQTRKVRIQENGTRFSIKPSKGGLLSKPFRFQGDESESFYQAEEEGLGTQILGVLTGNFVLKDSVLYTAPQKTGRYQIEAELAGKKTSLTLNVTPRAPSRRKAETTTFRRERRGSEPHRPLAEHWAPLVAQETWFQPKSDYIARFDFDGDWKGDNNWDSLEVGSSQAYVYYAVMETRTHWFLIYKIFHPRDYSDRCVAGTCHENDSEGLILSVEKDGSRFGRLLSMETLAHNNIYSYRADRRIRRNVHNLDGRVELYKESHPVIFIESGGHGVYGSTGSHSRYDLAKDRFSVGTGVTYVYKGRAERPLHPDVRLVGYDLLPSWQLWERAHLNGDSAQEAFDDYYEYRPRGRRRPQPPFPQIAGSFLGRKRSSNKAKPFWGWSDRRTNKRDVLGVGQWGLDPAYAVSQNLKMPTPFALDYVYNPYLGIGSPSRGGGTDAGDPAPNPSPDRDLRPLRARRGPGYSPNARAGRFDIRLRVDGTIDLLVRRDTLSYRLVNGKPPSDEGSEYTQALPQAGLANLRLEKQDGRGNVVLAERPTAANGYTATLRFSDPKGGDDRYHVRLLWEGLPTRPISTAPRPGRPASPAPSEGAEALNSEYNDPATYDRRSEGRFDFRGRVEGDVLIRIRSDQVWAQVREGRPVSVDRFFFSQPLPSQSLGSLTVERREGRGAVRISQRPSAANGYTAVVWVLDPQPGDDIYRFVLKWKR